MKYDASIPILIMGFILFLLAGGIFWLPFIIIFLLISSTIYLFFYDFIYIIDIFDRLKIGNRKYVGKHVNKNPKRKLHNNKRVYLGCGCAWIIGIFIAIALFKSMLNYL